MVERQLSHVAQTTLAGEKFPFAPGSAAPDIDKPQNSPHTNLK